MSLRNEGENDAARFGNLLSRLKSHLARADQPSEFCGTGVRHSVFGDLHVTEDASIAAPLKTYDSWLNYESPAHCTTRYAFSVPRAANSQAPGARHSTLMTSLIGQQRVSAVDQRRLR
ncbi:hypothetical protein CLIM01_14132 [Colletotrichum limetticola]|uniref:Uncharacterized protein n=1 Tax=Colletotrichum limetticola TaxID=1209924 RepID=A0ABQ9P9C6_9PEZI|nr:hypothetical protein CLIM01_14132 [Colletotrichum limetticola]